MKAFYTLKSIAKHLNYTAKQLKTRMHLVDTITVYDYQGKEFEAYISKEDMVKSIAINYGKCLSKRGKE